MDARGIAEKGGMVVNEAVAAMKTINDSSEKINEIITVIDEIAFQTNLLALNASVEAARAGDQGRGFAVVANEVRNLAQRSATSAYEIKDLIKDTSEKIESGSELVSRSGSALEEVVTSVKVVSELIGEIAGASNEQTRGIENVNHAVVSMDGLTQKNASLAEQTAESSESMNRLAKDLVEQVSFFAVAS